MATDFDLVLLGATGFTGTLVAEYLAQQRPRIRWALAGRNRRKLEVARASLGRVDPALANMPIVEVDALDPASVAAMCAQTRVVCTTVGPYTRYGSEVLAACARTGVHYCDLSGEVAWMRDCIDRHHETAVASGARVVFACGVDSIPSDMGVHVLHATAQSRGRQLERARLRVVSLRGGVSGGTAQVVVDTALAARDARVRRILADPLGLVPGAPRGVREKRFVLRRDPDTGRLQAPFLMTYVNSRIVQRSNYLRGWAYGQRFEYDEVSDFPATARGLVRSLEFGLGIPAVIALAATDAGNAWLRKRLPQPGTGPTEEVRTRGGFRMELDGFSTGPRPERYLVKIEGHGDPGYAATARMLGQAALCLATDELSSPGGLLTPSVAMGDALLARLRALGMGFSAHVVE